jgi:cysteine-rich repeat protein
MSRPIHTAPPAPRRRAWLALLSLCAAPALGACPDETPAVPTGSESSTSSDADADAGVPTTTAAPDTSTTALPTSSGPDTATSSASTAGSDTSTSQDPTTGEPCPPGEPGCTCLPGQVCADGLMCAADVCVEPAPASCGDGAIDRGEECDAGPANGPGNACKGDCSFNVCGDGDVGPGELCDDGNQIDDDACTAACTLASCGDGVIQAGELCDDGNPDDADACTAACTPAQCGDGIFQPVNDEACDAGPDNGPGKACKLDCSLNTCGDGDLGPGELCDDGNDDDLDACSNACTLASCGDGVVQQGELCDDGDDDDTDACTVACTPALCGDGILQPVNDEACDAGPDNGPGKACKLDCSLNTCGDGDQGPGEACDDGNLIDTDDCTGACVPATCGDGLVWAGHEVCDDGNLDDDDGCDADCTPTPCTFLWQNTYPADPAVTRHGKSVAVDPQGDIAIIAHALFPGGNERLHALKLAPDGALLWTNTDAIDLRTAEGRGVVTADGSVLAVATEFQSFASDMVRRFTPDGALDWLAYQTFPESSFGRDIALAPDGGVIIAGYRNANGAVPWLARLDPDTGGAEWTSIGQLANSTHATHTGVTVDPTSDIYTTGVALIDDATRLFVRRFDPAGQQKWAVTVTSPFGYARGWDVHPRPGGGVAVVGEFFYGNEGPTGGDLWVGAFDGDGALLWSDLHNGGPGQSYDRADGVVVGPDGHIHVAGRIDPGTFYHGIYRRYDADGALLCSRAVDATPDMHTIFVGIDLAPGGSPVLTGYTHNSVFVAKMTP